MSFDDTAPDVDVQPDEYRRLLGYPRGHVLDGRALELAEAARAWYAAHGRPWTVAREIDDVRVLGDAVCVAGVRLTSERLARTLRDSGADRVVVVAASAGAEIEEEAQRRWRDEKPDEYFFLEVYGSAVVERLVTTAGARLCAEAEARGLAVLPHYSPGYPDWDIADQARVRDLLGTLPAPVEVMESGMLRPKKSLLALFGVTPHVDRVARLTDLVPCQSCSLAGCRYRRAPYGRPRRRGEVEAAEPARPIETGATYTVSAKALRRWAGERLTLSARADGGVEALFRYEGTTCSNTGRALRFDYAVTLGPRRARYPIVSQRCAPAPADDGHPHMCRYKAIGRRLLDEVARESPLAGRPIDDVLAWRRPALAAGCYCERESREHKWGLVLETIHYALAQQERGGG